MRGVNRKRHPIAAVAALALALAPAATAQYTPTDMGVLASDFSVALDVNDLGEAAGRSKVSDVLGTGTHAFLWTADGGMVDLGTLGGGISMATGINNQSQIVGKATTATEETRAFLWSSSTGMQDLGTLGGNFSLAEGINELGDIVGQSSLSGAPGRRAAFWPAGGSPIDLGTLGGAESIAYGINDLGEIVGTADNSAGERRAFLWRAGQGMIDLGTLGGSESVAFAINNSSQVVGYSELAGGETRSFLWTEASGMVNLGILDDGGLDFFADVESLAYAINDLGQVCGRSINTADTRRRGYVWTVETGMVEIPTLGGNYAECRGISTFGQVAGSAKDPAGDRHGAIWTEPLAVTSTTLPDADLGQAYSELIDFRGGVAPYTWSLTQGVLPNGMALDAASGEVAGTPNEPGVFPLTVNVDGGLGGSASANLTLTVNDGGADTLDVTRARLRTATSVLIVIATSTSDGDVTLTVEGFGDLQWVPSAGVHRRAFGGVTADPGTITVTSTGGGSITVDVEVF
jgi:probable HAF family extracellular repeat protein